MANSFDLSVNVRNANPSANIDFDYGTYNSIEEACQSVPRQVRLIGKTVGVIEYGGVVEYWWKFGIRDEDLILKTGLSSRLTNNNAYIGTFVNADNKTSVTIPKELHKKGDYPIVQCFVNNVLTLFNVTNEEGNIKISWEKANLLGEFDVLNIVIQSSKHSFTLQQNSIKEFTIPMVAHECGNYPFVQVWCENKLENVFANIINNDGDITIGWDTNIELTNVVAVFAENYLSRTFVNANNDNSYVIDKTANDISSLPIVQCYYGNEVALADIVNNADNIVVSLVKNNSVNENNPLTIVVCENIEVENLGANDLAKVAWTGSYKDLIDKPTFVATYSNEKAKKSLYIPASIHKCGTEVTVQCKCNENLVFTDTSIDISGNILIKWSNASFVSAVHPLTIYVFGYKMDSKNIKEKSYSNLNYNDNNGTNNHSEEPIIVEPVSTKVKITLKLFNYYNSELIGSIEQYFEPNQRLTLASFDNISEYTANYQESNWYCDITDTDEVVTATLRGKKFNINYQFVITRNGVSDGSLYGVYKDAIYNEPLELNNIQMQDNITGNTLTANRWENPFDVGALDNNSKIYINSDEYYANITLVGYVDI